MIEKNKPWETTFNDKIETYIYDQMKHGKIPGLSVVIIKGDHTIYKEGFGYADLKKKQPVTSKTLFEIGANSKAFTALGILWLLEQGKINPKDPAEKYIPWFKMKYKGKEVQITIEQLLYHTSGLPFESVADIPESYAADALEQTVKTLVDKELTSEPGAEFFYATINYDVLGFIIEKVSGQSFEEFMKKNTLVPLELTNTYLSRKDATVNDMATGYKIGFLAAREYEAPIYRGNTPAGYFISNTSDMERWLKIQLGLIAVSPPFQKIIEESHQPNESIIGFRYAKGWFVFRKQDFFHAGNNPNFSSFILFSIPEESEEELGKKPEKIGIAILANMNSSFVEEMGWGILAQLKKEEKMPKPSSDFYVEIDKYSTILICISVILFLVSAWRIVVRVIKINKKQINFKVANKIWLWFGAMTAALIISLYIIYNLPAYLSYRLPWKVIAVWAPKTFVIFAIFAAVSGLAGYSYLLIKLFYPKPPKKSNELEDKK